MQAYSYKYIASAGDDNVVSTIPCTLVRVIVGKNVAASVIQIADSATDGDASPIAVLTGDALKDIYDFNVACTHGLTLDLANQTDVTVIYTY